MEKTGQVKANGQFLPLDAPMSVEAFLLRQRLLPKSVVVELNGEAIVPSEFKTRQISPGDSIEIVRIVAGG
jgi:sulfur carrier protein